MSKMSFLERATKALNLTTDQKLSNFYDKLESFHNNQIRIRKEKIADLEEEYKEALEEMQTTISTPETERIATGKLQKDYLEDYCKHVQSKIDAAEAIQTKIEELEEEIECWEERWKIINETADEKEQI